MSNIGNCCIGVVLTAGMWEGGDLMSLCKDVTREKQLINLPVSKILANCLCFFEKLKIVKNS